MVTVPTDSMGSAGQPAPVYAVCFAGHIQVLYILDTDHFRTETGVIQRQVHEKIPTPGSPYYIV